MDSNVITNRLLELQRNSPILVPFAARDDAPNDGNGATNPRRRHNHRTGRSLESELLAIPAIPHVKPHCTGFLREDQHCHHEA